MKRLVRRRRNQTESLEVRALLSTITVTSLADNTESDSEVTLREALLAANEDRSVDGSEAGSGADTIVFAAGLEGGTIELSDGQLPIKSDITIAGPTDRITIDAQEDSRVFIIDSAEEVSLLDLRLVNGRAGSGGAIRSLATTLSLTRTDFESNYAAKDAGAVHVIGSASGALNVTDSLFKYNGSARGYGAIRVEGSGGAVIDTVITDSRFVRNDGRGIVGSVAAGEDANVDPALQNDSSVTDSKFIYNTLRGSSVPPVLFTRTVRNTVFRGRYRGSGYLVLKGARLIEDSRFENTDLVLETPLSSDDSGVSVIRNSEVTGSIKFANCNDLDQALTYRLENVTLQGPDGAGDGVVSRCASAAVEIVDSQILNTSQGIGVDGDLSLTRTVIRDNTDRSASAGGSMVVTDSEITGNGWGLRSGQGLEATNTTISQNGSGVSADGQIFLNHVTIVDNTSWRSAGVENRSPREAEGLTVIRNSIIAGNQQGNGLRLDVGRSDYANHHAELQIFNSLIGSNEATDFDAAPPGAPDANGNILGTSDEPVDPRLGLLNDNGGGTATRALTPGSPARDAAATDPNLSSDQIGRSRTIGGAPDMGAFEFDPAIRHTPLLRMHLVQPEVWEGGGDLVLHVGVTDVPEDGETATVSINTQGLEGPDGAKLGEDFLDASTTLTFDATTSPTQLIRIPVIDDDIAEPNESLEVSVDSTSGDIAIESDSVIGTIKLSDSASIRSLGTTFVDESDGSVTVQFVLNGAVGRPFSAQASVRSGEADFGEFDTVLNFTGQDGETLEATIPIIDDTEAEDVETFTVRVSSDVPEVRGGGEPHRIVVESDDAGMFVRQGRLFVMGGPGSDDITVREEGDDTIVNLNGEEQTLDSADVESILVRSNAGADRITIERNVHARLYGGRGNDQITGSGVRDVIYGGPGSDHIYARGGSDYVEGGDGADTIYGQNGDDFIRGNGGYDSLRGGAGSDTLYGNLGYDTLRGGRGDDWLQSSYGNDLIIGDLGNDFIRPGDGDDTVHAGGGADRVEQSLGDDEIFGDAGDDSISDTTATIHGGEGNDYLSGGPLVFGEDGDDRLEAYPGSARLVGGPGHDRLTGSGSADTLEGGLGNDVLIGNGGDDLIHGNEDHDTLFGSEGNDTLVGGDHPDILIGGDGDDSLDGGRHKDVLFAGVGSDSLSGGGASDLLNASGLTLVDSDSNRSVLNEILNAWRVPEPYADRIAAVTTILEDSSATVGWDTADSEIDVFETDPSLDWLHVNSALDQFTLEDDELFVELNE